jgi:diguanylate cyclase (GGDEF)-like protein
MDSAFELTTVYVTNIFGIILIGVLVVGNLWRLSERNAENTYLLLILFFSFCGCVLDPIAYTADGKPGVLARIVVYSSNTLLYLSDLFGTFFWLLFLTEHLKWRFTALHRTILAAALIIGVAVAILNHFVPIAFDVSPSNVYERRNGFWLYMIIDYSFLLNSVIIYLICKHRGGVFKSFPILVYFVPLIIGTAIQSLFYGISAISASIAVSIAGIFATLQSERVFKDRLTGVFNYAYLDYLKRLYTRKKVSHVSGILININGFKHINQTYGRAVGNQLLVKLAKFITQSVGELGNVIRYSGDEFIAFINTQNEIAISVCITRIKSRITEFNKSTQRPYKLSVCFSTLNYDSEKGMEDFINEIYHGMREEKIAYYSMPEHDRRERPSF